MNGHLYSPKSFNIYLGGFSIASLHWIYHSFPKCELAGNQRNSHFQNMTWKNIFLFYSGSSPRVEDHPILKSHCFKELMSFFFILDALIKDLNDFLTIPRFSTTKNETWGIWGLWENSLGGIFRNCTTWKRRTHYDFLTDVSPNHKQNRCFS